MIYGVHVQKNQEDKLKHWIRFIKIFMRKSCILNTANTSWVSIPKLLIWPPLANLDDFLFTSIITSVKAYPSCICTLKEKNPIHCLIKHYKLVYSYTGMVLNLGGMETILNELNLDEENICSVNPHLNILYRKKLDKNCK